LASFCSVEKSKIGPGWQLRNQESGFTSLTVSDFCRRCLDKGNIESEYTYIS